MKYLKENEDLSWTYHLNYNYLVCCNTRHKHELVWNPNVEEENAFLNIHHKHNDHTFDNAINEILHDFRGGFNVMVAIFV
jgi:hypothetical protein